jgi:hypothetical protein
MRTSALSAVPGVITALVAATETALPSVSVVDGPVGALSLRPDVIVIGSGPPVTSADARQELTGLSLRADETFTIHCLASCISGNTTMAELRDRAYGLVAAIQQILRADVTLRGTCDQIRLGSELTLVLDQTKAGAVAEVAFDVTGRALL